MAFFSGVYSVLVSEQKFKGNKSKVKENNLQEVSKVMTIGGYLARALTRLGRGIKQFKNFIEVSTRVVKSPPVLIWIGDSHAHFIANNGEPLKRVTLTNNNHLVVYLGPRLLYSVATKGFQFDYMTTAILHLASQSQPVVLVFGEIDCRVHLVSKVKPLEQNIFDGIASNFLDNVNGMVRQFNFGEPILLSPVPPSDLGQSLNKYPRNGSILQRISVTRSLTAALIKTASSHCICLDLSQLLSDDIGALRSSLTDDGVHTNTRGSKLVLEQLRVAE